jgi:hypothetical protein
METIIVISLLVIATYLVCGLVFAIFFITKGITVIDESARGTGIGFRIIILPGVTLLWPLLLKKWLKMRQH